jgi:hypothetical protein
VPSEDAAASTASRDHNAACADVRRRTNDSEIDRGIDVGSIQCQAMFLEGGLDDPECLRSDAVQLGKLLTKHLQVVATPYNQQHSMLA